MTLEGVVDTDDYIDVDGSFLGDPFIGQFGYNNTCTTCHGDDGAYLNFGDDVNPVYVGTLANANPWELLHKIRFGDPGTPMPSTERLRYDVSFAVDLAAYAATLPTE
jgi:thiosulfate dehydrogenase